MFNRRRRNGKIIVWCFVLLLTGFVYGFFTNDVPMLNKSSRNDEEAKIPKVLVEEQKPIKVENQITEPIIEDDFTETVLKNDNVVTNNTKLILKTYYEKTRDTIIQERELPVMLIGKTLDELEDYLLGNYGGWTIREINKDQVELYQVSNQISPNYYVIKDYNGYITIFQVDEDGNMKLINQTEIPVNSLSDVDMLKIQEGIVVKGLDGIHQLLEDYSS
ncbi:MAG: hypothetical protein KGZ33_05965 [Alkaliphilus sp.]|nr:hypothetical protein [Alkaliphilus sp.]